ncbi:MAG: hypothetical protein CND89_02325 [Marine Group II euryarchaeote MED-G38]|nr:hypothetical protein [Euryarchaeota archaeon]PDH23241.1 MAG: hypothetical protein CND89_02325 [Marine Group II euryarchaeote MED-G38]|tara:strand:- start:13777 stop:14235 length:459 start_codon:yes stop_codon:yes gene_type:complete
MESYNEDQEGKDISPSENSDLAERLKDISQDRLVEEIITLWDEANNLELELVKSRKQNSDGLKNYSDDANRSVVMDYEEKLRVAKTKILRLEKQLQNEKIRREALDLNLDKIKSLELENSNLLKNEEELMILIIDMERHIEKLVEALKKVGQ